MYIEYNNKKYYFKQAIGSQSILYAEQYILAIAPFIFEKCNIPYKNKRVFGFTDSQTTLKSIYHLPENPAHFDILNKIRNNIVSHKNFWINKVTAHLDRINPNLEIKGNSIADKLANAARDISNKFTIKTPWFKNWDFSSLKWHYKDVSLLTALWDSVPLDTG